MEVVQMNLTDDITRHIAKLSGLRLTDEEISDMTRDLGSIVGYMDTLARLNTEGTEPLTHVQPQRNHMRKDVRGQSAPRDELIGNAPGRKDGYVVAPKTFGEGGGA
jgi:aspartyl-tRNA(Asn)/glutamyl-tRNA(Gln) amidotransferase subunit C